MTPLSENEKNALLRLIEADRPLPERWRGPLFPSVGRKAEVGKEYRLAFNANAGIDRQLNAR